MAISFFKNSSQADLYIDLGTANTVISAKGRGVVVNEPSVIAYNVIVPGKKNIIAVGKEAQEKIEKTPGNLFSARPLKEGVIADSDTTETMLRHLMQRPGVSHWLMKPRIIISIPHGITNVEKQAVVYAGKAAGAKDVILVDEPMAAAIGAGLPVSSPQGCMLIDFGGGTTEVAIIALSDIVFCKSIRIGGHKLDQAIIDYAKRSKNVIISDFTAERLKVEIGTAKPEKTKLTMVVQGRNATNGLSTDVEFSSTDIALALHDSINEIIRAIKTALENTPPELLSDIIDSGITLTGGGSLLRDLPQRIQEEVKIPVVISENPLTTIARGGEALLNEPNLLDRIQVPYDH